MRGADRLGVLPQLACCHVRGSPREQFPAPQGCRVSFGSVGDTVRVRAPWRPCQVFMPFLPAHLQVPRAEHGVCTPCFESHIIQLSLMNPPC